MQEIKITEIENLKIGHAQDTQNGTGCTVVLCGEGAPAGVDIRGGGPASRESALLRPTANAERIHAVLLSGGSAFGLDAAGGVMRYLEERDIGFDVGVTKVPLVCQSCLFDLTVGSKEVRPDQEMAYRACLDAERNNPGQGNIGAGMGASVGKLLGMEFAMKSGIGMFAVSVGELKIGAIAAVNALGDVFDIDTGEQIAGLRGADGTGFRRTEDLIVQFAENGIGLADNTTLGVLIINGKFDKTQMNVIASAANNGYARTIRPVNTSADGDSIYALSVGSVPASVDAVSSIGAYVMGKAVNRAVYQAEDAYGLPAYKCVK